MLVPAENKQIDEIFPDMRYSALFGLTCNIIIMSFALAIRCGVHKDLANWGLHRWPVFLRLLVGPQQHSIPGSEHHGQEKCFVYCCTIFHALWSAGRLLKVRPAAVFLGLCGPHMFLEKVEELD